MHRFLAPLLLAATLALPALAANEPKYPLVDSPLLSRAPLPSDYTMGKSDAPVTLIEYASMSCPHCAHFHTQTLPDLKKNYIDTGKVLYIFRHYPLNEPALKAAQLTHCVGQDSGDERFFTFVRVLFDAQNKWAFESNFLSSIETFAKVGGVSKERFATCMKDNATETKLLKIKQDATKELNVDRTPMLFINGHKYDADPRIGPLSAYLDSLLGKNAPAAKKPAKPEKTDNQPAEKPANEK